MRSLARLPFPTTLATQRYFSCSRSLLAGHNKWSKIKDRKGANDASRSAIFNKATLDILSAAKVGGSPDPEKNASLAAVIKRLKAQDVPKENIEKALVKASKAKGTGETTTYEALACGSVGIIIECSTDNSNRTVKAMREILTPRGGHITPIGFMFQRNGVVKVVMDKSNQFDQRLEALVELALDNGSEDFETLSVGESQEEIEFSCEPSALAALTTALSESKNCHVVSSELVYRPFTAAELSPEDREKVNELIETLEANDDTVRVWTNLPQDPL
ncbi:glucose-1-phosphate adenylyltransferase [Moniliophthora roreri]|uniref:Uncharacterized protein n=1 Tax=Moniliophthora roreri TaxID=221103 RepID=A0A0W0FUF5_MONRR|nr:glucose-1-phosphate adenylyltransferase [Moniliophthora roreri]